MRHWAERTRAAASRLGTAVHLDGPGLLAERIATHGVGPRGRVSWGGACRLMEAADDWFALSLARPDDVVALDALFEEHVGVPPTVPVSEEAWERVERAVRARRASDVRDRGVLLGLACAVGGERLPDAQLVAVERSEPALPGRSVPREMRDLRVVDLSSLWAGPLCTRALVAAGAHVVKVESSGRPDGARSGPPAFFELMNAGKKHLSLDLASVGGQRQLHDLLCRADVVVEGSRPRALRAMGLSFADLHRDGWRGVWMSITAHGSDPMHEQRVGFGDDAAVAGGLVAPGPEFVGDAVADPAAGLLAAVAVLEALADGVFAHLAVSLANTAAHIVGGAVG